MSREHPRGLAHGTYGPAAPAISLIHDETLVRVVAPHFVAGLVCHGDHCTDAAPILEWAIGKTREDLRTYFANKGWTASIVIPKAR